jgi:hypothetical protein
MKFSLVLWAVLGNRVATMKKKLSLIALLSVTLVAMLSGCDKPAEPTPPAAPSTNAPAAP